MNRELLRSVAMEEFAHHRLTCGPDDSRWVCKCGVEVPTDERGYPMGREHIVDRLLDVLLPHLDITLPGEEQVVHETWCQMLLPVPEGFPWPTFTCNCRVRA